MSFQGGDRYMETTTVSQAIDYGLSIVGAPYRWWTEGPVPDGSPAWAENGAPPPPEQVIAEGCFCAGVTNLMLRAVGKEIPTLGDPNWDGGTYAYYHYYNNKGVREVFDIRENYPEGTLIGRLYRDPTDQGHVAVVLGNGNVLQSYDAGLGRPGVNTNATIAGSHSGYYYEYAVRPENWIGLDSVEAGESVVPAAVSSNMTAEHLLACMPTNLSYDLAAYYHPYLTEAMAKFEISNKVRAAYFLANLAHESGELIYWEELADGWAYEWREDLGNIFPGDGPTYKGHGPIQITGRNNHRIVGQALGIDAETYPLLLTQVEYGFQSAAYYIRNMSSWGNLNEYADNWDFSSYVQGINGGFNGWDDRVYHLNLALDTLPEDLSIGA